MDMRLLLPPSALPLRTQTLWRRGAARISQLARTNQLENAHMYARHDRHSWLLEAAVRRGEAVIERDQYDVEADASATFILTLLLASPLPRATITEILDTFSDTTIELDRLIVRGDVCSAAHENLPITIDIVHPSPS